MTAIGSELYKSQSKIVLNLDWLERRKLSALRGAATFKSFS